MSGSSSSMGRVVVVGVIVMTLAMAAAAYTGRDLAQAAMDKQWGKVRQILSVIDAGQDLDLNARGARYGGTAIYWASLMCEAGIVRQLALAQADVNLPNTVWGATPVMGAAWLCYNSTQTTMRELISAGGDLALTDKFGETALHYAASANNTAAVRLLMEAGAPTGAQNKQGQTPAQQARHIKNINIADIIDNFTGITTTPTTNTGFTSVEAIYGYLIGGPVRLAVDYILYLLF